MAKITTICEMCGTAFQRFPAAHKHAAKRGTPIRFCSLACNHDARRAGKIVFKTIRGEHLTCEACAKQFYRTQSAIEAGRKRFCSEPCRQKGFDTGLIDRTRPRPTRLLGEEVPCVICGEMSLYRKKSVLARGADKTCGAITCISAYGRDRWGLPPRDAELFRLPRPARNKRATNFRTADRKLWLGTSCLHCGSTTNLQLDHIIPVALGGLSTKDNAQTLCGPCNLAKNITDRVLLRRKSA